jgi:hypothetical protein
MKNIIVVKTADRFMPLFFKMVKEYFNNSRIYILHTTRTSFEIEEFDTKEIIIKGSFKLIAEAFSKLNVDFICLDNYKSFSNIRIINRVSSFKKIIFNIGLYLTHDKISYSYIRFGTINNFFIGVESLILMFKHRLFLLYVLNFQSMDCYFYGDSIVLFWNKFSEINFKKDYSSVKTDNLFIYENSVKSININKSCSRILFTPSMLGAKSKKLTEEEFIYWSHLAKAMSFANDELHFSISIHPMYKNKLNLFETLNKKHNVFNEIFCGFDIENNNYDLLITDISTLYWIAPLYGLRTEMVENIFIHKKYYRFEID